ARAPTGCFLPKIWIWGELENGTVTWSPWRTQYSASATTSLLTPWNLFAQTVTSPGPRKCIAMLSPIKMFPATSDPVDAYPLAFVHGLFSKLGFAPPHKCTPHLLFRNLLRTILLSPP